MSEKKMKNETAPDNNQEPQKHEFVTINIPVDRIHFEDWHQEQLLQKLLQDGGDLHEVSRIIEHGLRNSFITIST